jgi:hypothetical protein
LLLRKAILLLRKAIFILNLYCYNFINKQANMCDNKLCVCECPPPKEGLLGLIKYGKSDLPTDYKKGDLVFGRCYKCFLECGCF